MVSHLVHKYILCLIHKTILTILLHKSIRLLVQFYRSIIPVLRGVKFPSSFPRQCETSKVWISLSSMRSKSNCSVHYCIKPFLNLSLEQAFWKMSGCKYDQRDMLGLFTDDLLKNSDCELGFLQEDLKDSLNDRRNLNRKDKY